MVKTLPQAPSDDKRWKIVDTRMRRLGGGADALIEALHAAQEAFGYIDDAAMLYIGSYLGVPPSKVYGVATFYSYFTLKPQGAHTCVVCTGTACYINGAGAILKGIEAEFGIKSGGTTQDGRLSALTARCVGACSIAPVVVIDGELAGQLSPEGVVARLAAIPQETTS
ncbi:MAG: bidirectional hydrogenase complex protein HoxE [Austwickia sp.]|nr:bidirectional hydrogenase complex protein HoxE [Actinomycetota bacterium]MCB1253011.1 bidirectional hydrogenase complex protein HoxE [Austwickia sp.]MCO5307714.1 bidirectional hydrogenase complex protein HoxE [Austwickia sp.]